MITLTKSFTVFHPTAWYKRFVLSSLMKQPLFYEVTSYQVGQ